ncbi:tetratricopeptide repeat protein [Weissella paramesenteroides]|nr:tetratricopeptide repeat protein [Weissella paramesenteroides]MDF8369344.1 tetratricopeptide repeat protein [Weissella paramesenteroides]MDF8371357.1 tetratricopeptide repeat protein [Weissella paramesenteroides]QPI46397.1 tetratricopeptide repeat protein [Weissella paramesenteroides]RZQ58303.1 tetratricopeptide repeat protein [Weissella paramesenteroides]
MASFAERMLDELSSGQLDAAKKSFASSLRYDDDDTIYSLAEELYGLGFSNQAKRAYKKLLDKYPDEDQLRTSLADIAIDEDNTDQALMYLSEISKDSTAYIESLLVAADLYQSEGLTEAAEDKLLTAYQQDSEEPIIQFALAEFYFATAKYQTAIPYYRQLIKNGERYFSGLDIVSRIGVAYALVGNFDNALGYLEQINDADMTPDVRFQLGLTYATNPENQQKAIKTFTELRDIDASYVGVYDPLAQLYIKTHEPKKALLTYQEGIAVDPFNIKFYQEGAKIAAELDENEQANALYKEGLANNPDDSVLVTSYSNFLVQTGNDIDNINLLNDFFDDDDTDVNPQLYWNLAQSYTALEDFEMATKYWHAALPFFMDKPDFLKPAYYYFRDEGERELALQALQQYVKLVPEDYDMVATLQDEF